jgi:hypothetical protein
MLAMICISVYTAWPYRVALSSQIGAPVFVTDENTQKRAVVNQYMKTGIAVGLMSGVVVVELVAAVLHMMCAMVKSPDPYAQVKEEQMEGRLLDPIEVSA